MALLDDCKLALRISSNAYDSEINDLIAAAKLDIKETGIVIDESSDNKGLWKIAVLTYVKANFGFNNPDAEALRDSYQWTLKKMALLASHRGGA